MVVGATEKPSEEKWVGEEKGTTAATVKTAMKKKLLVIKGKL